MTSVPSADPQTTLAATLVDEWIRGGVRDAVICPGSRSTPLALALVQRPELSVHVRLDERGAGFFAVGLAGITTSPVIVLTTSGTAAAELHPAVIEAHHHGVPLVVCTADRPPELQDVGASQTIEQDGLYGSAVRWACSLGVADLAVAHSWRSVAARMLAEARHGPRGPGPVHVNVAFREPLVGEAAPLPWGRPGTAPWHVATPHRGAVTAEDVRQLLAHAPEGRGLLMVGEGGGPPEEVLALAEALGWPVLAEPRSGARRSHPAVVAAADGILRSERARHELEPELVIRLGAAWTSRVVASYLQESVTRGAALVLVDPWWGWSDPDRMASVVVPADPGLFLSEALEVGREAAASLAAPAGRDPEWLPAWQRAEAAAQGAIDDVLGDGSENLDPGDGAADEPEHGRSLDEPTIGRRLLGALGSEVAVVVSSSMPVRDMEWYAPALERPPAVWFNGGANGIDGVVATALGIAASGTPVVAVLGDLAFLHDIGSLVSVPGDAGAAPCTLVVVDNGGGGIFSFLPQADSLEEAVFERLFATPMSTGVVEAARGLGAETVEVRTWPELAGALRAATALGQGDGRPSGPTASATPVTVVRAVVPTRAENVARHEQLQQAVIGAVEKALG